MAFTRNSLEALNLLLQFDDNVTGHGLKVHSSARPEAITACRQLFDAGLIDRDDGGYLTDAGIEAREHAQTLVGLVGS